MICFYTDQWPGEPDILTPLKRHTLHIRTLDGDPIVSLNPPESGWTHDRLVQIATEHRTLTHDGADAFLGDEKVGSTEV